MSKFVRKDDDGYQKYESNPTEAAFGASQLIYAVVWSIVVLTLLVVGLMALHIYLGWF